VEGAGRTIAQDQSLNWGPGDAFVIPGWSWSEHRADQDAVLFEMSDEPVLQAMCLYRRQRAGENAPAHGA